MRDLLSGRVCVDRCIISRLRTLFLFFEEIKQRANCNKGEPRYGNARKKRNCPRIEMMHAGNRNRANKRYHRLSWNGSKGAPMDFVTRRSGSRLCVKTGTCRLLIRTSIVPIQSDAGGLLGWSILPEGNGDWLEALGGQLEVIGRVAGGVLSPWMWGMWPDDKTVAAPVVSPWMIPDCWFRQCWLRSFVPDASSWARLALRKKPVRRLDLLDPFFLLCRYSTPPCAKRICKYAF